LADLAGFFYCEDFTALILSALLTDAVGQLALVTVGTLGGADRSEEVVAAAFRCALFGMAAFRIRHYSSLSSGPCPPQYEARRRLKLGEAKNQC